jgi:DNA polymerase III delta prime subunit
LFDSFSLSEFTFSGAVKNYGIKLGLCLSRLTNMEVKKKKITESEEQEWEDPLDPENPSDERDKEQIVRQYKEAKRRKDNLTEKDHIDKEPKTD